VANSATTIAQVVSVVRVRSNPTKETPHKVAPNSSHATNPTNPVNQINRAKIVSHVKTVSSHADQSHNVSRRLPIRLLNRPREINLKNKKVSNLVVIAIAEEVVVTTALAHHAKVAIIKELKLRQSQLNNEAELVHSNRWNTHAL